MLLKPPLNPPVAKRVESIFSAHGETWVDYYEWLRPKNWKEVIDNPSALPTPIAEYLTAENDYHDQAMAPLTPLIETLKAEIRGRMSKKLESLPVPDGDYIYRYRFSEDDEHPIYVRTSSDGSSEEEIVFDVNAEASKHAYFELGDLEQSPDHSKLLWSMDTSGAEFFTLSIRDIKSGKDKEYAIEQVYDAVWADNRTLFYTHRNEDHQILKVYRHTLDTDPANDVLVFEEKDSQFGCGVSRSLSRKFLFIHTASFEQDEWWYIPLGELDATPVLVQARQARLEYSVDHQSDRFIISTNAQGATNWKLVETPINTPAIEQWTDLVAYQDEHMIEDVLVLEDWVVWLEQVNALPQIAYMDSEGTIERVLFEEEAYHLSLYDVSEYQASHFVYGYSSPTTPREYIEFDLGSGECRTLKRQLIPSGHEPTNYITRRFNAKSDDGALVPVTVLHLKDTPVDGTAPAYLYGYGSYGASCDAEFDHSILSLVDRGFVYAIAHVRGGSEKGMQWYEDSKLAKKTNSFHDFIAVANTLVENNYCSTGNIVSHGESAGGLLVGASMHMQSDLFAGVIAGVPDVDVLSVMLDENLPGIAEHFILWGNPALNKPDFDAIKGYSPYENVESETYPCVYATAGVSDPRVFFWQPAKWVAKLRALKTDENVVLLRTNLQSGHFGKMGRFAQIEDTAKEYAFAVSVTHNPACAQ